MQIFVETNKLSWEISLALRGKFLWNANKLISSWIFSPAFLFLRTLTILVIVAKVNRGVVATRGGVQAPPVVWVQAPPVVWVQAPPVVWVQAPPVVWVQAPPVVGCRPHPWWGAGPTHGGVQAPTVVGCRPHPWCGYGPAHKSPCGAKVVPTGSQNAKVTKQVSWLQVLGKLQEPRKETFQTTSKSLFCFIVASAPHRETLALFESKASPKPGELIQPPSALFVRRTRTSWSGPAPSECCPASGSPSSSRSCCSQSRSASTTCLPSSGRRRLMPYPSYTGTPCHTQATQVLQLMCRLTQLYKFSVLAQRESSCERSMGTFIPHFFIEPQNCIRVCVLMKWPHSRYIVFIGEEHAAVQLMTS